MEKIIAGIKIEAEIQDPIAIKFYSMMPSNLRKAYAEILLTGAAYLATQKDIANDSLQLIKNTAKKIQEEASNKLSEFVEDKVPDVCADVLDAAINKTFKKWLGTLPNAKDYPDPKPLLKLSEQMLILFKVVAESKGQEKIINLTTLKGFKLQDAVHQSLQKKYGAFFDIEDVTNITGSIPRCKAGDYILKSPRFKICIEVTDENLSEKDARIKISKAMMNREADGAVLVFGNCDQIPGKIVEKIGMNKFWAYFGDKADGTWDVAINMLIGLIDFQKMSELGNDKDVMSEVAKLASKLPDMIAELDKDLKAEQARAKRIESAAGGFRDSIRVIRADKLAAIRQVSDLLLTFAKPKTKEK